MSHDSALSYFTSLDIAVGVLAWKDTFCHNFIPCAVATFRAMSLVRMYPEDGPRGGTLRVARGGCDPASSPTFSHFDWAGSADITWLQCNTVLGNEQDKPAAICLYEETISGGSILTELFWNTYCNTKSCKNNSWPRWKHEDVLEKFWP